MKLPQFHPDSPHGALCISRGQIGSSGMLTERNTECCIFLPITSINTAEMGNNWKCFHLICVEQRGRQSRCRTFLNILSLFPRRNKVKKRASVHLSSSRQPAMLRRWPGCTNRLINGCGVGVQIFLSPAFFSILHLPATIDSMKESYLAVANKAACCCIQRQHKRAATDLYTRSYRGWSQCTLLLKDLRRVTDTL